MALAIFSEERRKWWTLAAVSFGLLMIMLDRRERLGAKRPLQGSWRGFPVCPQTRIVPGCGSGDDS